MSVHKYSTTADSNTNVGDGSDAVSVAEGMPRGDVNNAMRSIVSDLAKDYRDSGGITSSGTGLNLTLSTASEITDLVEGIRLTFKTHAAIQSNATLNVNGIGGRPLMVNYPRGVSNVEDGAFSAGSYVQVVYNGDEWVCLNQGPNNLGLIDAVNFRQKIYAAPFFGDDVGTDTQIYPGSQFANQGVAWVEVAGQEKLFVAQRPAGTNFTVSERTVITEWDIGVNGSAVLVAASNELNCGHPQDLSAVVDGANITLFCSNETVAGHEGDDSGKGYSKIDWNGAATNQGNVTSYQLFGYAGSGHQLEKFFKAVVGVSTDGLTVSLAAQSEDDAAGSTIITYIRADVEGAVDPLDISPVALQSLPIATFNQGSTVQGLHVGENLFVITRGFNAAFGKKTVELWDFNGKLVTRLFIDGPKAQYGLIGLLDNPTLGVPTAIEPEGVTMRGSDIIAGFQVVWHQAADVVSYKGENFAAIRSNTLGFTPENQIYFVKTLKAATSGAWDPATDYSVGARAQRTKVFYKIGAPESDGSDEPLDSGISYQLSGADVVSGNNGVDISYQFGDTWQVKSYSEALNEYLNAVAFRENRFRIYDQSFGADNSRDFVIRCNATGGVQTGLLDADDGVFFERNGTGVTLGSYRSGILVYGVRSSTVYSQVVAYNGNGLGLSTQADTDVNGTPDLHWVLFPSGDLSPFVDGQNDLGSASRRISDIHLSNSPIVTSDQRLKTGLEQLEDRELKVAIAVGKMLGKYRWLSEVEEKGDNAIWHFGLIAQDLVKAFQDEGLDPMKYGVISHSEWGGAIGDEDSDAQIPGDRYSVRYEELSSFVLAALTQKILGDV